MPGDTSEAALERLPALLEEHRPQLVLVSLGGNDFLRGIAAEQTDAALRQILVQVRSAGAQAVLVAVPRPSAIGAAIGKLSDHPLYESVAQGAGVPLLAGTDTGPYPNSLPAVALHDELELLVRCGLQPAEALALATSAPARRCRPRDSS